MSHQGKQIGPYILTEKLGQGGFGEVWLAEKRSQFVTKKVAVKLPHDGQVKTEAIRQEATLWEQASGHPNVLPIIDADIYDGQVVIVSEYAEGGSLAERLKNEGRFPADKAVEMIIGILDGLEFLHSRNIIHRDIKPQNILLQGNRPRLADFGISRAMNTSTISSTVVGTDAYMSPEAFDGKRNVQTDIWSVGVVLYELLTGGLPFPQEHPTERMFAVLTKDFSPLPDEIPNELKKTVERALAKKGEERFQTAAEMRAELQQVMTYLHHPQLASKNVPEPGAPPTAPTVRTGLPEIDRVTDEGKTARETAFLSSDQPTESFPVQNKETASEPLPPTVTIPGEPTTAHIPQTEVQINSNALKVGSTSGNKSLFFVLAGVAAFVVILGGLVAGGIFYYFSYSQTDTNPPTRGDQPVITSQKNENLLMVEISNDHLLLNDREIGKYQLFGEIKRKQTDQPSLPKIVHLSAAADTRYEKIFEIVNLGRGAGFFDFGLLLAKEEISASTNIKLPADSPHAFFQQMGPSPLTLVVALENNGQIKLNGEVQTEEQLASSLRKTFDERERNGVFRQGTNEVDKTVFVKASNSAQYGDVLKLVRTTKKAGADQIGFQVDDLGLSEKSPESPADILAEMNSRPINFSPGGSNPDPDSEVLLRQYAEKLKSLPTGTAVEIGVHTDSDGSDEANMQLSENRAQAIRKFLTGLGVGEKMLTAKGYGETQPIAPNTTPEGKSQNRRVAFRLVK
ncbi:MAG: protein kinase [Pyrinomonadaceae bacterium]